MLYSSFWGTNKYPEFWETLILTNLYRIPLCMSFSMFFFSIWCSFICTLNPKPNTPESADVKAPGVEYYKQI